ncbi:CDP-alcohol phosphatidyltransferase [Streptomyces kebangsaanensis]|uniref:CDP-alcohol phosphatidyltransferase n=1 Tax=Streptomyces kebangsaanensis TaxID=864058 RepID=A0ABW6KJF2_9ACTN
MPQHTSTRQSSGTTGASEHGVPPSPPEAGPTSHEDKPEPTAPKADTSAAGPTKSAEPAEHRSPEPEAEAKAAPKPKADAAPDPAEHRSPEPEADAAPEPKADTTPEPEPAEPQPPKPKADAAPEPAEPTAAVPPPPLPLRVLRALRPRAVRQGFRRWQGAHPAGARVLSLAVTVLALLLVVVALLLPNKWEQFEVAAFTRIPVEALLGAALLLVLPRRARVVVAVLGGVALGVLTVLNLTDIEFNEYLGRSFNVILDWQLLDDAQSYLADTLGGTVARLAAVGVVLLVLAVLAVMALSVVRVGGFLGRHKTRSTRGLLLVSALWMLCSTLDVQVSGFPVASEHTVTMIKYREKGVRATLQDERDFARTARADAFGDTPGSQLVPDLRGKDMIFTFIESYGRSAIEDPIMAPGVNETLDVSTQTLAKAGFHAKSGWLTSATYGGGSWLGHSTFMSGLWVDNQNRYRTVTSGDRLTLTEAFRKTGAWDTVGIMPGVQKGWPEAKWYGLDKVYNAFQMGYQGPKFSWSTMPDQYALEALQRLEHGKKRDKPLASFVILTSSHQPWAPVPEMVDWDEVGDGSVFRGIEAAGTRPADIITDPTRSREEYGRSVQYSMTALTEWMERYAHDDTVLVVLGDHQPVARVSGENASRDVPCSIVAKDPKVLEKIADWGWSDGLRPAHDAPVWRMNSFRDRFLTAYGSTPHPTGS